MVLKASCRPATPKSTLSAWASSARCVQARSCLRPFAGFLSCLRSSPQCPRSLLLYFFRFLLKRQPLCRTSLGHPVSTTTHVLRTFCAFNLLYFFFQSTYHHPKFYFLYILCSYVLLTRHPREFYESGPVWFTSTAPLPEAGLLQEWVGALSTQL